MPRGRSPPLGLGMYTRRTGLGRYVLVCNSRCNRSNHCCRFPGVACDAVDGLPIDPRRAAIALDQLKRILQQIQPCQFTIQAPEPVPRFGLGLAIERALEFPKLLRGCYLLRAISRSFTPLRRVRTSSVPCDRPQTGPRLRVQRPEIQPAQVVVTMNASDFQTDRRPPYRSHRLGRPVELGFPRSSAWISPLI